MTKSDRQNIQIQQDFLKDWHNQDPGMTQRLLTRYTTNEGKSSYQILIEQAGDIRDKHCVDLACGDGTLLAELLPRIGDKGLVTAIDMSRAELDIAKQTYPDQRIIFHEAMAQAIPLLTSSVDLVFCHLALMLMTPIEPVLNEIARILKSTGQLCAVIIAPLEHTEPTKSIFAWIRSQVEQKLGYLPNIGDSRFASEDGIKALFSTHPEFMPIENFKFFYLQLNYQTESLWTDLSSFYLPRLLSHQEMKEIGNKATEMLNTYKQDQKQLILPFACRSFCVKRR